MESFKLLRTEQIPLIEDTHSLFLYTICNIHIEDKNSKDIVCRANNVNPVFIKNNTSARFIVKMAAWILRNLYPNEVYYIHEKFAYSEVVPYICNHTVTDDSNFIDFDNAISHLNYFLYIPKKYDTDELYNTVIQKLLDKEFRGLHKDTNY